MSWLSVPMFYSGTERSRGYGVSDIWTVRLACGTLIMMIKLGAARPLLHWQEVTGP
jgi:hypothetical protein